MSFLKIKLRILSFTLIYISFLGAQQEVLTKKTIDFKKEIKTKGYNIIDDITPARCNRFIRNSVFDFQSVGTKLFTQTSMKILSATVPVYLIARHADNSIHKHFYNDQTHSNINQPGKVFKKLIDSRIIAVPVVSYVLVGSTHGDPFERRIARIYGLGLLWTWGSKVLLKQIKSNAGLRPDNEYFIKEKNYYGGNPSGHTATAMFTAMYLGLIKGPKWAIPVGLYAGYIGAMSVVLNRHFVSQVVTGAALGSLFAFAANTALRECPLPKNWDLGITSEPHGGVGMTVAYNF